MNLFICVVIISCFATVLSKKSDYKEDGVFRDANGIITSKIYSNILARRREEHRLLYKHLMSQEKYENKYKMLEIAYSNMIDVIAKYRRSLDEEHYFDPSESEFPREKDVFEGFASIVENTCLFGDLILHMPTMSYKILNKIHNWKEIINWSLEFTRGMKYKEVIDPVTEEMLSLFDQEINLEKRTDDYLNPYVEEDQNKDKEKKKEKKRTVLKQRGPKLAGGGSVRRNEL